MWHAGGTTDEASDRREHGAWVEARAYSTSLRTWTSAKPGLDGLQLSAIRIVVTILGFGLDGRIRAASDTQRNTRL
jgi:hypothetical protein